MSHTGHDSDGVRFRVTECVGVPLRAPRRIGSVGPGRAGPRVAGVPTEGRHGRDRGEGIYTCWLGNGICWWSSRS